MTKTEQIAVRKAAENYEKARALERQCLDLGPVGYVGDLCPKTAKCPRCGLIYQARAILEDQGVATRAELAEAATKI